MEEQEENIFSRTERLVGKEGMSRIKEKKVIVFGIGGVGSWCAESLVRTGIEHLTIVDFDKVSITNVNRQDMATTMTIGMPKTEALKERLLSINPNAEINAIQGLYSEETADNYDLNSYDYVIDAIDSLKDKLTLILKATAANCKLFSSMGAALKMDPTQISVAEFWKVKGCPLGRMLRKRLNQSKRYPSKKFLCVYSPELLPNQCDEIKESTSQEEGAPKKAQINGSLAHITAIFGFTIAGLVMQDIIKQGER